jgi:hypothetical protein
VVPPVLEIWRKQMLAKEVNGEKNRKQRSSGKIFIVLDL